MLARKLVLVDSSRYDTLWTQALAAAGAREALHAVGEQVRALQDSYELFAIPRHRTPTLSRQRASPSTGAKWRPVDIVWMHCKWQSAQGKYMESLDQLFVQVCWKTLTRATRASYNDRDHIYYMSLAAISKLESVTRFASSE